MVGLRLLQKGFSCPNKNTFSSQVARALSLACCASTGARPTASSRDTAQLFQKCVEADTDFAIVHGVSDHKKSYLGIDATREVLGYTPQDGTAKRR